MDRKAAIFEDVKEILVDSLGVEPEEVTPAANFFHDLGGESIDVLDLSFHCEKRFGTRIRFQELTDPKLLVEGPDKTLAPSTVAQLQQRFAFLDPALFSSREPLSATSLFTVGTIVGFVEQTLAEVEA